MFRHSKSPDCANEHDVGAVKCPVSFERFIAIYRGHGTGGVEIRGFQLAYGATVYGNPDIAFFSDRDYQIMNFVIKYTSSRFSQE